MQKLWKIRKKMNADILKELPIQDTLILIKSLGLRKKYEELLILRYAKNFSCDEIAAAKHKEVQTIRNEICKARKLFDKYTGTPN